MSTTALGARAWERVALVGADTTAYRQCRRVIVRVVALQQQQTSFTAEELDEAVECLMVRGLIST